MDNRCVRNPVAFTADGLQMTSSGHSKVNRAQAIGKRNRMSTLRLILGDQLSMSIATLSDIDKQADWVLMVEVNEEATYVRHHQQKLSWSSRRCDISPMN